MLVREPRKNGRRGIRATCVWKTTRPTYVFVLFSSMCEQKVSTYMPSWALLVMTAVCKEVRKKTIELLTRIKQKLKGNMSIITKMKNKRKWTNITNVLLDLIDEIQRYTKEKEDLGPFPLQWKALEALN
jgi:hypothetical protein